jgi:hypothetical protein
MSVFPMITKSLQEAYEQGTIGSQDKTPELCGYYGRACRQLDKPEGANRMLCQGCGLAKYAERTCALRDPIVGCRNCVSNSKHICERADANQYIELPVYSEEANADGAYDLIGYRKEYVD